MEPAPSVHLRASWALRRAAIVRTVLPSALLVALAVVSGQTVITVVAVFAVLVAPIVCWRALHVAVDADEHGIEVRNTLTTKHVAWGNIADLGVQVDRPGMVRVGFYQRWGGNQVVIEQRDSQRRVELQATFEYRWSQTRNEAVVEELSSLRPPEAPPDVTE